MRQKDKKYIFSNSDASEPIKYCLYFHRNSSTQQIFYVGVGNSERPYDFTSRNFLWKNYVNKYGNPIVEIYKTNLSVIEAFYLENYFITKLGRRRYEPNGVLVNITLGGAGALGHKHSSETKAKISNRSKGENNPNYGKKLSAERIEQLRNINTGRKHTNEVKARISKAFAGKNGINTGRKHTEEAKRNMSLAKQGRKWSEKQRMEYETSDRKRPPKRIWEIVDGIKIGWGRHGHINSEEVREKISKGNKGKTVSEEARKKMSETRKKLKIFNKKVIDINSGKIYDSIGEAANVNNVNMKTLSNWLRNINPSKLPQLKYYNETI